MILYFSIFFCFCHYDNFIFGVPIREDQNTYGDIYLKSNKRQIMGISCEVALNQCKYDDTCRNAVDKLNEKCPVSHELKMQVLK